MAKELVRGDNFVLFGDGTQSLLAEWLPFQDPLSGKAFIRFTLWPSSEQVVRYNLVMGEDIDPVTGLIVQEYEEGYVELLELNPTKIRIFVTLSFDGKPTKSSLKREDLLCTIDLQEKRYASMCAANAVLQEDLRIERTMKLEAMKQNVDIIREANRVRGHQKLDSEGDEDIDEE